jgi:hypothetical protein
VSLQFTTDHGLLTNRFSNSTDCGVKDKGKDLERLTLPQGCSILSHTITAGGQDRATHRLLLHSL